MLLQTSSLVTMVTTIIIHQNFIEALVDETSKWKRNFCLYLASLLHSAISCILYGYMMTKISYSELISITTPFSKIEYMLLGMHAGYFISDIYEMIKIKNIGFIVHHIMGLCFLWSIFKNDYGGLLIFSMLNAESTAILINIRYFYFKQFGNPLPLAVDYLFWTVYVLIRIVVGTISFLLILRSIKYNGYDIICVINSILYLIISIYWSKSWLDKIKPRQKVTEKNK